MILHKTRTTREEREKLASVPRREKGEDHHKVCLISRRVKVRVPAREGRGVLRDLYARFLIVHYT